MRILIDIGNTRLKWCVEEDNKLSSIQAIEYKKADLATNIRLQWSKLNVPSSLAISCVAAKQISKQIIEIAQKKWPKIKIIEAKSSAKECAVTNAYPLPEKLGIDRWLGLIALNHYYPSSRCIVDCGTTITIDFLDEKGLHLGGVISPGIQLMRESLIQGTEALSSVSHRYSQGLSNNTQSAIYSGTLNAAAGLIEKVVNKYRQNQLVVLTGGDAEIIAENLSFKGAVELEIVLKGLFLFCRQQEQKL